MKILFYIPVITHWWFDNIIVPMIKCILSEDASAEIHVMAGSPWRNTGLSLSQLTGIADFPRTFVHYADSAADETASLTFRLNGVEIPGVVAQIQAIDPDVTLARSADFQIVTQFPGKVRFITEGAAPPYQTHPSWIVLDRAPFHHGSLPEQASDFADICKELVDSMPIRSICAADARARLGLPAGRRVLGVPLHYEHEENFFLRHAAYPDSLSQIRALIEATAPDVLLAITDHPLNRLYVDRSEIHAFLARFPDRAVLCEQDNATVLLAAGADAMVIDLSKAWSLAAFNGTPIVNIGRHPMADWIAAIDGIANLPHAANWAELPVADPACVKLWYGWHLGARLLDPARVGVEGLLRRLDDCPAISDFQDNLSALRHLAPVHA